MNAGSEAFIDSDVVISSLLSDRGAAYLLLSNYTEHCIVSSQSVEELERVVTGEKLSLTELQHRLLGIRTVPLGLTTEECAQRYAQFVLDPNDAHIIAGAVIAKARFLITYNVKDYVDTLIKNKLGVVVLRPGNYLQYVRFLESNR